ncbi:MAG TPA: DUF6159 family protein [Gammaproteobacteria bacterium]|nr:DUF6159 family protein [Gammaproteobacteria bacterium]
MDKLTRSWRLMIASWNVLKQERSLIVFPILSGIGVSLVIASFWTPLFNMQALSALQHNHGHDTTAAYTLLFLFYFCCYLITIFFNSALVACALDRMDGNEPTLGYGLSTAWERFPQIFGWAFVASTVGLVLRMIEERVGFIGRIVISLLGMAWTVTSFLVVPVLIAEKRGPIQAYKESTHLLKESWGEQIIGNVGFGMIVGLVGILPALFLGILLIAAFPQATVFIISIGVLYFIVLMLVQSTLFSIYQAAVYRYAADGKAPPGFEDEYLADAFRAR